MTGKRCADCGIGDPIKGQPQCEPCYELVMLLQARAILCGADFTCTADHLRALERCIMAQADAIASLQAIVANSTSVQHMGGIPRC